jgi:hypothetical protein
MRTIDASLVADVLEPISAADLVRLVAQAARDYPHLRRAIRRAAALVARGLVQADDYDEELDWSYWLVGPALVALRSDGRPAWCGRCGIHRTWCQHLIAARLVDVLLARAHDGAARVTLAGAA